ncbi:MAG: F0F1 ATP synthase subunit B [Rhodospirillaceae bacterium]
MLNDATFWVAVAFVLFVAVTYKRAGAAIFSALDQRGTRIRQELEEAQRLREDAQAVLEKCQKRQLEAESEAEKIIAHAHEDAARVRARAEAEAQAAVKRREAQALDRIAQAESQALAEVRNVVADVTIEATKRLLADRLASGMPDTLIDRGIHDLGKVLN